MLISYCITQDCLAFCSVISTRTQTFTVLSVTLFTRSLSTTGSQGAAEIGVVFHPQLFPLVAKALLYALDCAK